jgi:hypothetical protein
MKSRGGQRQEAFGWNGFVRHVLQYIHYGYIVNGYM